MIRSRYLDLLRAGKDKTDTVKVLTGMRRTGKSTILRQFRDTLDDDEDVVAIDIDLLETVPDQSQLRRMITEGFAGDGIHHVFIDEIQDVEGWERAVAMLVARGDCDVYITGSNAKMLSSELVTKISGRYTEVEVHPLSFREYLELYPGDRYERFGEYLRFGALPIVDPARGNVFCSGQLEDVFNTVIVKDVLSHIGSKDVNQLVSVARFLYSNIGNVTNIDNISKELGIGYPTVQKYVDEMIAAHLFHYCERFDIVGKKILRSKGKFYATDIGMRRAVMKGEHTPDISRPLENIVYMELIRRGYTVRVGSYRDSEVDFTVTDTDGVEYYQVAQTMMADGTRERELRPLVRVNDNYRKTVLTMDRFGLGSYGGIEVVNVIDWLCGMTADDRWACCGCGGPVAPSFEDPDCPGHVRFPCHAKRYECIPAHTDTHVTVRKYQHLFRGVSPAVRFQGSHPPTSPDLTPTGMTVMPCRIWRSTSAYSCWAVTVPIS